MKKPHGWVGQIARAALVVAAMLAATAGSQSAAHASTWSVSVEVSVDGAPIGAAFQVTLLDPIGSATVNVFGLPVVVGRTADGFSLSVNTTRAQGCPTTIFLAGGSPIQTGSGNSLASGGLSGGLVQSCSSSTPPVQTGVQSVYYYTGDSLLVLMVPVYSAGGSDTVVVNSTITGSFSASSAGVLPPSWVEGAAGDVVVTTPVTSRLFTPGTALGPGALLQTGSTGAITLRFRDGGELIVSPNTQATLLPAPAGSGVESLANLITGKVRITTNTPGTPDSPRTRVKTPNVSVATMGTDFSTEHTQTSTAGSSVIEVQQGRVEVTNRRLEKFSVAAGVRAVFEDQMPRVIPVLPIDQGEVVAGATNTFFWTRFPGAARYIFEFTANPFGFSRANSPTVEFPASALAVVPGAFTESSGLVQFPIAVPAGVAPSGTRIFWRVFPANTSGQVLAGTTASDTSVLTVR